MKSKTITTKHVLIIATASIVSLALALPVLAQERDGKRGKRGDNPCRADVERLCPDADNRKEARACIKANLDAVSDVCTAHIEKKKAKHQERAEAIQAACSSDINNYCSDAEPGRELKQCMRQHRDELSQTCSETLASLKGKKGKKGKKGGEGRAAVKAACAGDFQTYCGDAERGERRSCVKEHRESFSETCQEALQQAHSRRGKRGKRG